MAACPTRVGSTTARSSGIRRYAVPADVPPAFRRSVNRDRQRERPLHVWPQVVLHHQAGGIGTGG